MKYDALLHLFDSLSYASGNVFEDSFITVRVSLITMHLPFDLVACLIA
jgi:hypothetical protein